jgi:hypothetical protein
MITISMIFSISSIVVVMGTWITYLRSILRMQVAVKPTSTLIFQSIGIGLGLLAIFYNIQYSEMFSKLVFIPAIFAIMFGSVFWLFYAQRKTPIGNLKVKVGDKLLPFTAATSDGRTFDSDELTGKRILLKFFRGAW